MNLVEISLRIKALAVLRLVERELALALKGGRLLDCPHDCDVCDELFPF